MKTQKPKTQAPSLHAELRRLTHTLNSLSDEVKSRLWMIERTLLYLVKQGGMEMANLQDIRDAVQAESDVQQSVITLLGQISQKLADAIAQNDPAAMQQVVDDLNAHRQQLADAVVANTPAANP